ncbi:MAG: glycosyltransferase family 4 protein [Cyclobacteriaceae bacterium]
MARKILMLLNAPYPADIRVKKETDAIIQAGYKIHLLCLRKNGESRTEEINGLRITRIDAGKNNYQLAFWDVIMSIHFIHPKFKKTAIRILKNENINTIHIHDLPLAGTALSIKKKRDIKVVIDLHENYPEALKTWFKWKKNPIVKIKNALFMNPSRWTEFEKKACVEADHIIAVVEEMRDRLINSYDVTNDKITVVTNTEDKHFVNQTLDSEVYNALPKGFIVTYSGGIGPHRGVDTAIKGMSFLKHLPIHLAIVGFGSPAVMNSLKQLVNNLGLTNVHFLGYQPFNKFYSFMHLADANVIPHQSNGHTDNTVPHKLFQGMMAEKPLIVSTCTPLKRYIQAYNCGVVFNAGDAKDFAKQTEALYCDQQMQTQLSKNGFEASMQGPLNWESTQKELISLYDKLEL